MPADSPVLRLAISQLESAGVPSPRTDAQLLWEYADGSETVFRDLIAQRAKRIPLQHLTGVAYFRYLELEVGPGVFIPRPETELLTQVVIDELKNSTAKVAVELCAGSGAVAISIATEVPGATVYAVEKSPDAFRWLQLNADMYAQQIDDVGSSLILIHDDATQLGQLAHIVGAVNVVVSNPPYIPEAMIPKEPEVRDHDPHLALFGGSDGFDVARGVIAVASQLLVPNGLFGMEHADVQGESVKELLNGWTDVLDHQDYNRLPRYVTARLSTS